MSGEDVRKSIVASLLQGLSVEKAGPSAPFIGLTTLVPAFARATSINLMAFPSANRMSAIGGQRGRFDYSVPAGLSLPSLCEKEKPLAAVEWR